MSILKLNEANPGVKRPLKVEDLADLWEGIEGALATGVYGVPRIICGFDEDNDSNLTPGVIAFQQHLYVYDTNPVIAVDDELYAVEVSTGDNRVMGDGTTQLFSYARKVTNNSTVSGAVRIGEASAANLEKWKSPLAIPTGSISTGALADGSVTTAKLAAGAVQLANIAKRLTPCTVIYYEHELPVPDAAVNLPLLGYVAKPSESDYDIWATRTINLTTIESNPGLITLQINDLPSYMSFADMPTSMPLFVNVPSSSTSSIKFRIEANSPVTGNPIYTSTYAIPAGSSMLFMLSKLDGYNSYIPVSQITLATS